MSVETGFWGVGILFALLLLRVPVALSLIAVSFGGIVSLLGLQPAFGILSNTPYSFVASWTMSAVPMFLLMGFIAFHTGLTGGLFDAAQLILAGPGLERLSRDCGAGDGEQQQQNACDLGCHESSLACFCAVEANQYFER